MYYYSFFTFASYRMLALLWSVAFEQSLAYHSLSVLHRDSFLALRTPTHRCDHCELFDAGHAPVRVCVVHARRVERAH